MRTQQAVVVIPIYKENLTPCERVSLVQVRHVLGRWPIIFFAPDSLVFDFGDLGRDIKIERFADKFFISRETYSELLLESSFYERFFAYEYMLVYQLDAFVFADRLKKFCESGYDYIGAPWTGWAKIHRFLHITEPVRVGNGGFSLRKIKKMYELVLHRDEIIARLPWEAKRRIYQAEDWFFGYCGAKKILGMRVPNVNNALKFSYEHDVSNCFAKMSIELPFGCHDWYRFNFYAWKPFIEGFGYRLPETMPSISTQELRMKSKPEIAVYLLKRALRTNKKRQLLKIMRDYIGESKDFSIWGYGKEGKLCLALLRQMRFYPKHIYDRSASGIRLSECEVRKPLEGAELCTCQGRELLIIATTKYEQEIFLQLRSAGLIQGRDFLSFSEMQETLMRMTYHMQ